MKTTITKISTLEASVAITFTTDLDGKEWTFTVDYDLARLKPLTDAQIRDKFVADATSIIRKAADGLTELDSKTGQWTKAETFIGLEFEVK